MSRVGKSPVRIPGGVSIDVGGNREVTVKGPGGTLTMPLRPEIEVEVTQAEFVTIIALRKSTRSGKSLTVFPPRVPAAIFPAASPAPPEPV